MVEQGREETAFRIERSSVHEIPFAKEQTAVRLHSTARRVPQWQLENDSTGPLPSGPIETTGDVEEVLLIPYGCARLRIAEFPVATS